MRAHVFPNEQALQLALTSGLVPRDVQAAPAEYARWPDGTVVVRPARPLGREALEALQRSGVRSPASVEGDFAAAQCWAEVLPARRAREEQQSLASVLFALPGEGKSLLELCGEMLRLGCDRQEFRLVRRGATVLALLRASEPPYYTVTQALDHVGGLTAYVPTPAGQDRVWTEIGYAHPLVGAIEPAPGNLLLIPGRGPWLTLEQAPWTDVYQLVDVELPPAEGWSPGALPSRLRVPLRLANAPRAQAPSMWVLREGAVEKVDALVRELPEDLIARLLFAVSGDVVVLRARQSREGPPVLAVAGEPYAPLFQIPNLFAPADAIVEPPLRRDRLRELLAPDSNRVSWLFKREGGSLAVESLPENAFAPLSEWVEYVIGSAARELEPWMRAATFDFEPFESAGGEWAGPRDDTPVHTEERARTSSTPRAERAPPVAKSSNPPAADPPRLEPKPPAAAQKPMELSAAELSLATLESQFLTLDAPADAPARQPMWTQMAELNARLGRRTDAGLCWTRALWEADAASSPALAEQWASAEGGTLSGLLDRSTPTVDETRAMASQVVHLGASGRFPEGALHATTLWLDAHDDNLDVRSLWLSRAWLARLSGSDRLALARARDRVLARLHRGLSIERDVPRFLRFTGAGKGGRDTGVVSKLAAELERLLNAFLTKQRKRKVLEAPPQLTMAYVRLVFAFGFARLGMVERARALRQEALSALDLRDPIHGFLTRAFGERIEQAFEGRASAPLSAEVQAQLSALTVDVRYRIDRLRQASQILEPLEHLSPTEGWLAGRQGVKDPLGNEFAEVRGVADPEELARRLEKLVATANATLERRFPLLDGVLDFLPRLPESRAIPLLAAARSALDDLAPPQRAKILEDALRVAAHFDREALVAELARSLESLFQTMGAEHAVEAGAALSACVRTLRRVGRRDEATVLLSTAANAIRGETVKALTSRLALASGFAYLGRLAEARPIIELAFGLLERGSVSDDDRLKLTRAVAQALTQMPSTEALQGLSRLAEQLPLITDSYAINTHLCQSVVEFADALVLGYLADDLAMGETGRRFLEEDEYLVRRRVHRDMEQG